MSDPLREIRQEILAQPEADRLDYALDLLAFYLDPVPEFVQGCAALGVDLSPAALSVLHALDARRGRIVSLDSLVAAHSFGCHVDLWPRTGKITDTIRGIRREIDRLGLGVEIESWRGLGYRLTAPEGFRFEAAAPADRRRAVGGM